MHSKSFLTIKPLLDAWQRLRGWSWAAVLVKLALWSGAFVALAHIGSGTAARLLGAVPGPPTALSLGGQALAADSAGLTPRDAGATACPVDELACRRRDAGARPDASTPHRAPSAVTHDGRVILNLASETDLTRLPGIGPKRAKAIIELRTRMGRFRHVADLLRVRGIGRRSLQRLRPHVVVDPPKRE